MLNSLGAAAAATRVSKSSIPTSTITAQEKRKSSILLLIADDSFKMIQVVQLHKNHLIKIFSFALYFYYYNKIHVIF